MARPLRIEFPGAVYHIISRGNAKQAIFIDDEKIMGEDGTYELRESAVSYSSILDAQNARLRPENTYFWKVSD